MTDQIKEEFGRQAAIMASAPAFNEEQAMRRIIAALGPAPLGKVLEVACGPGIVAEQLAPLADELVCLDATPEMLRLAEIRLGKSGCRNVSFSQALAEDLPFADGEFDLVFTRLSIHHFRDVQAVLAECRRVLRLHGRLLVVDIISSTDQDESCLHNALEQLRDPTHVRMLSHPELLATLRSAGFVPGFEDCWEQQRSFTEWARIVSVPGRTEPLRYVMRRLSRAGLCAGVDLHETEDDLQFTHKWLLVEAQPEF